MGGFERAMSAMTRIRFFGSFVGGLDQLVRPGVGAIPADAVAAMRADDAAQVLDQRQAQHDRQRPQFAQSRAASPSGKRPQNW